MKRFFLFLIILCVGVFAFSQDSTKTWDINKLVYNLRKKVNSLNFQYNGNKSKDFQNTLCSNIFALKSLLDDNYPRFSNIPGSDSIYRQSLLANYTRLEKGNIDAQVIGDLRDDIVAKISSFDLGLEQNRSVAIPVVVTTYDSSLSKVSGYYVYWNFWLDKENPNAYAHFSEFTNPSSAGFLVPAVYDIWVQKAGDKTQFPPLSRRTKYIISTNNGEKLKPITIVIN